MTKIATTPNYGKNPLNLLFSGIKRQMAMGTWYVASGLMILA